MTESGPVAVASAVAAMVVDGRFDEVEALFAPELRAAVSAETVRIGWTGEISRVGAVVEIGRPASESSASGLTRVSVQVSCERGALVLVMSVDEVGLLHGLRLTAPAVTPWRAPRYVKQRRFTERDVVVGPHAVPGTLSTPRGRGQVPGVVLLGGGGVFDRDETSGSNKPLKDLAWGLASRGIAVVRYDKAALADGTIAAKPGFTMSEEYVPDAIAAVRLLQGDPAVDPDRVFVLGHSMGGRVAPRVAATHPSIAGLVILAGDTQPLQRSAVRVARYIAGLGENSISPQSLAALEQQAALVDSTGLSTATASTDLLFGWPASYWLDLRNDDPAATAAALGIPMLILQGGRDYQVTLDDLAGWQSALAHRTNVAFRVYDADDHLFFPGTGASTPAGYEPPQHVDPAVVSDIAAWVMSR